MNSRYYILSLIILIFLGITTLIGIDQFIWTDEGYTMLTTSHKLIKIPAIALKFELQPPIYFLIAKIWRLIFDSAFWMRVLSILITCFSIIYFEKFVRLITDKYVMAYTLLFALNPATIWVSLEIRSYGLMVFMSIVLLYFFYKHYLSEEPLKIKHRIIFSVLALLGVWTNYYLILLLISNFIVLILVYDKKRILFYFVDMVFPALSTLLFIPFFATQFNSYTNGVEKVEGLKNILLFVYYRYEEYLFTPKLFTLYLRYIIRILFLFVLAFKIRQLIKLRDQQVRYLFYHLFALTLILLIFIPFVNKNMIKYRHTLFLFPVVFVSFLFIISQHKKILTIALFVALGVIYLLNAFQIYYDTFFENGIVTGAHLIGQKEKEDQDILIYRNELELVFRIYYNGENRVEVMPFRITVDKKYNHDLWNIESEAQVAQYFQSKKFSNKIWLLTDTVYKNIFGVDYNYNILDNYVDKNYNTEFDTIFEDGIRVRRITPATNDPIKVDSLAGY